MKRSDDPALLNALAEFLKSGADEQRVQDLKQKPEVHLAGNDLYIPAATRATMEEENEKPFQAIFTKTDSETGRVYMWAASPTAAGARPLRLTDTMGGAHVGFAVPLRKLELKFPASRRLVLTLNTEKVPDLGTVWWISFLNVGHEPRNIDQELMAAATQVRQEQAKARQVMRIQKITGKSPATNPETV